FIAIPSECQFPAGNRDVRNVVGVPTRKTDKPALHGAGSGAAHLQPPGAAAGLMDDFYVPTAVEFFIAGPGGSCQQKKREAELAYRFLLMYPRVGGPAMLGCSPPFRAGPRGGHDPQDPPQRAAAARNGCPTTLYWDLHVQPHLLLVSAPSLRNSLRRRPYRNR